MKAVVAAFNQEKALVGAFSVITNLRICFGCNFLEHLGSGRARSNWCGTGSRGSEVAALTRLYVANWDPAGDQSGEGALGLGKWIEMDRSGLRTV